MRGVEVNAAVVVVDEAHLAEKERLARVEHDAALDLLLVANLALLRLAASARALQSQSSNQSDSERESTRVESKQQQQQQQARRQYTSAPAESQ